MLFRSLLDAFGREIGLERGHCPLVMLRRLMSEMYKRFEYSPKTTRVDSPIDEALQKRQGVCQDFTHMGVAFCRALNIPARYVCGYLPDIDITPDPVPMDFHAWFEAFIDGQWRTFDARHNRPRAGRLIIAQGRDASDVAFTTSFGSARLTHMKVWADETTPDTTLDTPPNPRIF